MIRTSLLVLLVAFFPSRLTAQSGSVTGSVTHEGRGVPACFVWIARGAPSAPTAAAGAIEVTVTATGFEPPVTGVERGRPLVFRSGDTELHDVQWKPAGNPAGNAILFQQGMQKEIRFGSQEWAIPVSCEAHPASKMAVFVMAHPYFAVTDASGRFTLNDVPPGKYAVALWHASFSAKGKLVEIGPGAAAKLDFAVAP